MSAPDEYDYAIIRVVPRVDREEFINVGVILSCATHDFLDARIHVDRARIAAFAPALDLDVVEQNLRVIPMVCHGGAEAGPIGSLTTRQRFHWLVAPRSAIIQMSSVHSGFCGDPDAALDHLLQTMVLQPAIDDQTSKSAR